LGSLLFPAFIVLSIQFPVLLGLYLATVIGESMRSVGGGNCHYGPAVVGVMLSTHLYYCLGVYLGMAAYLMGRHELSATDQHEPFEARLISIVKA